MKNHSPDANNILSVKYIRIILSQVSDLGARSDFVVSLLYVPVKVISP